MTMPSILRAREEDALRIRQLMERSVSALPSRDWFADDDLLFILRHIEDEGYTLKYVTQEQILAGYLIVRKPGRAPDNLGRHLNLPAKELDLVTHMESVCVDPAFRGQKIFYRLLETAIAMEREDPCTEYLMATVHPDNRYSRDVLMQAGFVQVAAVNKYGGWERIVLLLRL